MSTYWEFLLIACVVGVWVIYLVAFYLLLWRSSRTVPPIYGPADHARRDGQPRPNFRVVR